MVEVPRSISNYYPSANTFHQAQLKCQNVYQTVQLFETIARNLVELTLSICETEFKAFSGLLSDRMIHRLQRHSSSENIEKKLVKVISIHTGNTEFADKSTFRLVYQIVIAYQNCQCQLTNLEINVSKNCLMDRKYYHCWVSF